MRPPELERAPRCGAKTRWNGDGHPCLQPAMANGRCRLHGGKNPGGPKGHQRFVVHGRYSAAEIEARRQAAATAAAARDTAEGAVKKAKRRKKAPVDGSPVT
jgi:hypothetical protein